jgi:two-component system cell cycle sensor histidine kinase/response regulator CckA
LLDRVAIDAAEAARLGLPGAGAYVLLEVADTGSGMSEEVQRRAFEPFFTTKAPGVGTGLGLATVYAVTQRHGGSVEVRSQLGKGTLFRVFLRPSGQPSEPPSARVPPPAAAARRLRVLLAENDAAVREITRRFLEQAGHSVVAVGDGVEATAMLRATGSPFDLLVLDAIMPRRNGPEVYRELRAESQAPVLFVSGHEFNALDGLPPDPARALLRKPFGEPELAAAIDGLAAYLRR